ncbi:MAG: hypothetical protein ACOC3V_05610 [bacterium]
MTIVGIVLGVKDQESIYAQIGNDIGKYVLIEDYILDFFKKEEWFNSIEEAVKGYIKIIHDNPDYSKPRLICELCNEYLLLPYGDKMVDKYFNSIKEAKEFFNKKRQSDKKLCGQQFVDIKRIYQNAENE